MLLTTAVFAQSAAAPAGKAAAAKATNDLEEVMVTAQRKEENLERTPVTVAVVTSEDLVKLAVVREEDLRSAAPGLTIRSTASSNQLNYAIRGQSLDAFSNSVPGVLPYFNEVQIGGDGGSSSFYDLGSVQVLKGPQGTLFGRSATGGAVLFTSQKPTNAFGGYVSAGGGDYGLKKAEGAINVPLATDTALARLAGTYDSLALMKSAMATNTTPLSTATQAAIRAMACAAA